MKSVSPRVLFATLVVFGLSLVAYAADTLTLVKERSQIEFVGTKPGGSHRGGFRQFAVDAVADWGDLSQSRFTFDIDATSLWTDNNGLTGHLKNSDFFDVPRNPSIRFETTRIELRSASQAVVTGSLTMLGKSVEMTIPASIEVSEGGLQVKSDFTLDRMQWGMTYAKGRIDDDVKVSVKLFFGR